MEIIESHFEQDFSGSHRKYYDLPGARIIDVHHFDNTKESWHKHEMTTEVLFVLEGKIEVKNNESNKKIIKENEIVSFETGEWHIIKPLTPTTRILTFKYMNINSLETIKNDWEGL